MSCCQVQRFVGRWSDLTAVETGIHVFGIRPHERASNSNAVLSPGPDTVSVDTSTERGKETSERKEIQTQHGDGLKWC